MRVYLGRSWDPAKREAAGSRADDGILDGGMERVAGLSGSA